MPGSRAGRCLLRRAARSPRSWRGTPAGAPAVERNWTRRRRSRRGGVFDLAADDGVEQPRVDQPGLLVGELLSRLCRTDEVAEPGGDDELESMWAGALRFDAGSLEI